MVLSPKVMTTKEIQHLYWRVSFGAKPTDLRRFGSLDK